LKSTVLVSKKRAAKLRAITQCHSRVAARVHSMHHTQPSCTAMRACTSSVIGILSTKSAVRWHKSQPARAAEKPAACLSLLSAKSAVSSHTHKPHALLMLPHGCSLDPAAGGSLLLPRVGALLVTRGGEVAAPPPPRTPPAERATHTDGAAGAARLDVGRLASANTWRERT
jgi:hypothetical protein